MRRPILGTNTGKEISINPSEPLRPINPSLQGPRLKQRLREKRSKVYLDALTRMDAGTHHADRGALDSLVAAISNEFPELGIEQRPIGIVSQCYLGAPFEVHICD